MKSKADLQPLRDCLVAWAEAKRNSNNSSRITLRSFCEKMGINYHLMHYHIYNGALADIYRNLVKAGNIAGGRFGQGKDYGK